ncbi:TPA: hypothetical protein ACG3DW_006177 [Pseudomonas aeruginosa]|uniref:hypothetical protein n=1 Tax=Pseudomonas TaxID=286 RepID=UPI00106721B1|nr:hypothetical protein [Pseudomonas aeruginosa]EJA9922739.1 hypothetical protein [Pseudomonas aeruginosa]EJA9928946.1 hypothetical protein [Pseudomonas aeruginosa]EKU5869648.1 hypothetical protein [Pseudomonas aeruginosa]EKW4640835.1 hypothetical protein [Pseudomonas aeruginosa]EKX4384159.1 hypothetical protein [Pseudomonas aeruginosa]
MARVIFILEDTPNGVSLDVRQSTSLPLLFGPVHQTPALRLGQLLHEHLNLEMALDKIPPHQQQHSKSTH